jgi:tetratricopeptide (TPR) repeat protein
LSLSTLVIRATYLGHAGRHAEAVAVSDQALAVRRTEFLPADGVRALSLLMVGRREEAVAAARIVTKNVTTKPRWWVDANAIYVLRQTGHEEEAKAHAERLIAAAPPNSYYRVYAPAALGRVDEALDALARTPVIPTALANVFFAEMWAEVRESPKFIAVIKELHWREQYELARATLARMQREQPGKK